MSQRAGRRISRDPTDLPVDSSRAAADGGLDLRVMSIGGASRSGSTLLALLLGRAEGFFVAGELRYVWSRGFLQNELCGCGTPFLRCSFWRAVLSEAYGSPARVPIHEIQALHSAVSRIWHFPESMSPIRRKRFNTLVQRYLSHLERLYMAIQEISGATTIIDSSKLPSYCYLLSRMHGPRVRLLHLVRDSRAVAFSFMRKRRKPEIHWREGYMRRFSPLRSAFDWNVLNLGMEAIRASNVPCALLRYEDLVQDPLGELSTILPSLSGVGAGFLREGAIPLGMNHTVAGNPIRFAQGTLPIRPDTEWKDCMKKSDRSLVTATTWPLLIRYGYISSP